MKTHYPYFYTKTIICKNAKVEEKEGKENQIDYYIKITETEDYKVIRIITEPSEEKAPPDKKEKTYPLEELDQLAEIAEKISKNIEITDKEAEINFYIITPNRPLNTETIKTKGSAEIIYGKIEQGEIKLESITKRIITKKGESSTLPENIIISLEKETDTKINAETALNITWAISLARSYAKKLEKRYKSYEKNYPKINQIEEEAIKAMQESLNNISTQTIDELEEIARKTTTLTRAIVHDLENTKANYYNLENALRTIGNPQDHPETTLGKQIVNAWETLKEKTEKTTQTITTTYNIIRTKLQLENIQKQRELMETEEKQNNYLLWIQIITGALLISDLTQATLTGNWLTITIVTTITLLMITLLKREKK